eukprot:765629-Hanusia_phi.AAC.1
MAPNQALSPHSQTSAAGPPAGLRRHLRRSPRPVSWGQGGKEIDRSFGSLTVLSLDPVAKNFPELRNGSEERLLLDFEGERSSQLRRGSSKETDGAISRYREEKCVVGRKTELNRNKKRRTTRRRTRRPRNNQSEVKLEDSRRVKKAEGIARARRRRIRGRAWKFESMQT